MSSKAHAAKALCSGNIMHPTMKADIWIECSPAWIVLGTVGWAMGSRSLCASEAMEMSWSLWLASHWKRAAAASGSNKVNWTTKCSDCSRCSALSVRVSTILCPDQAPTDLKSGIAPSSDQEEFSNVRTTSTRAVAWSLPKSQVSLGANRVINQEAELAQDCKQHCS